MATPSHSGNSNPWATDWFKQQKWITLISLPVLLVLTYFEYYSVWGALFVFWGIISVISGQVFLVEPITRSENPVLFWAISAMWIAFGVMYILADIYPQHWGY